MSTYDSTSGTRAMRELGLIGHSRWLGTWTFYVLALLVGRVATGAHTVDVGELTLGAAPSWLVGWSLLRGWRVSGLALGAVVVLGGLAVGLLAHA